MATDTGGASFGGLIDLAAEAMGGQALACSDDFFAGMENLIKPGRGVFLPDEYTDRGKWMDGWESRRKRGPGHDWCTVRLGVRGRVRALDIDTNHFLGNHPPFASLEAARAPHDATPAELDRATWTELVPQSPLRPGSQNLFAVSSDEAFTHLRLRIYPDGGVARLRVWGSADPEWGRIEADHETAPRLREGEADLASVRNGALALACSDAFFGPMNNLIAPGRAANMGGGWETRRKRLPGHDWILVRLGAPGSVGLVEVDTNHFKGNYPDRFALHGVYAPGAAVTDLVPVGSYGGGDADWQTLIAETKLGPSARHFFRDEIAARGPFTHVRLDVFPDGGVSRLRIWGSRA
ncbi:MAG TPA: allantoicase [Polyangiaceae bacterium]|nr:allantoicase [Polyangiaceae bacterium]